MRLVRPAGSPPPRTASSPGIPVSKRGGAAITAYSTSMVTALIGSVARSLRAVCQLSQGRCRSVCDRRAAVVQRADEDRVESCHQVPTEGGAGEVFIPSECWGVGRYGGTRRAAIDRNT